MQDSKILGIAAAIAPAALRRWEFARIFSLSSLLKKVSSEIDLFSKAGFFQTPLYNHATDFATH